MPCGRQGRKRPQITGDLTDLAEKASQRLACFRRQFDEHPTAIMRIGTPNEEALADHGLEPPQRSRRGHSRSDTQARYGHAKLGDFRLQQVKQHVPRGIGEQVIAEITSAQAPSTND